MLEDARELLSGGADALVSGCLTAEGIPDIPRMKTLADLAHEAGKKFTFHRAFDMCREPFEALEVCRMLGVDTILTSGQEEHCLKGLPLLKTLYEKAGNIEILIGAGVNADVIRQIRREIPQALCFHMSGKVTLESSMEYRKPGVSMGLPGISEYVIYRTGEENIAQARAALDTEAQE